jgi:uncharacterized surface protein with fasciclin (FAS1) repeats
MLKKASVIVAVALVVAAAAPYQTVRAQSRNIVETAVAAGSFTTLAKALQAADLVGTLSGPGPFTVFAPTDEAFAKLPAGTLDTLLRPENRDKLKRVLTYHVVGGKVGASDVVKLTSAKALSGDTIAVSAQGGTVRVDGARVVKADVQASNGVIHVIDAVILPKGL